MNPSRFDTIARIFAERRLSRRSALATGGAGIAAAALGSAASAQDATPSAPAASPVAETDHASFLFVQTFGAGAIEAAENGHLTLTADHLTGQTIFFSDRPERIVGTVPTEDFLGLDHAPSASATPASGEATPEGGIGFTPANPPNAALVFDSAVGSEEPGDVVVVELINPTYDRATGLATYEITVLADETAVDLSYVSEPVTEAAAIRQFDGASLFIDNCSDGDIVCVNVTTGGRTTIVSADQPTGYCWDSSNLCCSPCEGMDYWWQQCYLQDPTCGSGNSCYATYDWQVFDCPIPTNPY